MHCLHVCRNVTWVNFSYWFLFLFQQRGQMHSNTFQRSKPISSKQYDMLLLYLPFYGFGNPLFDQECWHESFFRSVLRKCLKAASGSELMRTSIQNQNCSAGLLSLLGHKEQVSKYYINLDSWKEIGFEYKPQIWKGLK